MYKTWVIGRKNSDILFEKEGVSKRHGVLKFENGKFFLEDLNSTNGTKIKRNGSFINVIKSVELFPKDMLFFADFNISFEELIKMAKMENSHVEQIRCKECLKPISNQNPCPFCGSTLHLGEVT